MPILLYDNSQIIIESNVHLLSSSKFACRACSSCLSVPLLFMQALHSSCRGNKLQDIGQYVIIHTLIICKCTIKYTNAHFEVNSRCYIEI